MNASEKTEYEKILSRMTVIEKQIMGRAGQWKIRNGMPYDEGLHAYVRLCPCCHHLFLAQRVDKKTCSETCKKKRAATLSKANLSKCGENGQMKMLFKAALS